MKKLALATLLAGASLAAFAQSTPVGLWKTIDDETNKEKSYVRIADAGGGRLLGKVEKIIDPAKQDAEESALFNGGEILDPANGKTYKVRLKPVDGGKKLEVRGYIGAPMFGRTQTWLRAE